MSNEQERMVIKYQLQPELWILITCCNRSCV